MSGSRIDVILRALEGLLLHPQGKEFDIHDVIAEAIHGRGVSFEREFRLGPRCRVDFLCADGIAIEVKKGKPNGPALTAQVTRYAAFEAVSAVVIVVERCVFDAPDEVHGKPVHYVALSRNWGISL